MSCISVLLVDDHRVVSRGVRSLLESFPGIEVVATARSGEEALAALDDHPVDIVLMDLLMPGGMDGVEATLAGASDRPTRRSSSQAVLFALKRGLISLDDLEV